MAGEFRRVGLVLQALLLAFFPVLKIIPGSMAPPPWAMPSWTARQAADRST